MCGRFTQAYTWAEVEAFLSVFGERRNLQPHYNLAPTDTVHAVTAATPRTLTPMRWGLIPYWWKKPLKELPATFNARAESIADRPMFRDAYKRRRCIIPASGFYEWTGRKTDRQPHYFTAADGAPILSFAGLWERWRNPDTSDDVSSCTIVVTSGNDWMKRYHDRMPAILDASGRDAWLDGSMGASDLTPAHDDTLHEWLVSKRVNRSGVFDDDLTLIQPIEIE